MKEIRDDLIKLFDIKLNQQNEKVMREEIHLHNFHFNMGVVEGFEISKKLLYRYFEKYPDIISVMDEVIG